MTRLFRKFLIPRQFILPAAASLTRWGATVERGGVNFSLFSENATGVDLLLFDKHDDLHPKAVISLDPKVNKTFHFWHIFVEGAKAGIHYGYRVEGPYDVQAGMRFDRNKVLIDPYSRGNNKTCGAARPPAGRVITRPLQCAAW